MNPDELDALIGKATDDDLTDGGLYFDESNLDLTQCGHGETGEYLHRPDGQVVEWLWNHRHDIATLIRRASVEVAGNVPGGDF